MHQREAVGQRVDQHRTQDRTPDRDHAARGEGGTQEGREHHLHQQRLVRAGRAARAAGENGGGRDHRGQRGDQEGLRGAPVRRQAGDVGSVPVAAHGLELEAPAGPVQGVEEATPDHQHEQHRDRNAQHGAVAQDGDARAVEIDPPRGGDELGEPDHGHGGRQRREQRRHPDRHHQQRVDDTDGEARQRGEEQCYRQCDVKVDDKLRDDGCDQHAVGGNRQVDAALHHVVAAGDHHGGEATAENRQRHALLEDGREVLPVEEVGCAQREEREQQPNSSSGPLAISRFRSRRDPGEVTAAGAVMPTGGPARRCPWSAPEDRRDRARPPPAWSPPGRAA